MKLSRRNFKSLKLFQVETFLVSQVSCGQELQPECPVFVQLRLFVAVVLHELDGVLSRAHVVEVVEDQIRAVSDKSKERKDKLNDSERNSEHGK